MSTSHLCHNPVNRPKKTLLFCTNMLASVPSVRTGALAIGGVRATSTVPAGAGSRAFDGGAVLYVEGHPCGCGEQSTENFLDARCGGHPR
ncbi:hypothetical protein GCM10010358_79460 [Streptomyces minutiscleroticus]|uniref:Uncharacterized protein n=1 Tax=Streptomyces minutiscleroticus TaxID=68238 RepID=A0A918U9V3_9ACTN|nr:hypothetical protein GCM10010358_79460 [Streptomyces minutiscleroticus]